MWVGRSYGILNLPSLFVANLGPVQEFQSSERLILNDWQGFFSMICWELKRELLVTHLWHYRGQNGMSLVLILWQKYTSMLSLKQVLCYVGKIKD
jgi:hypothetical protein